MGIAAAVAAVVAELMEGAEEAGGAVCAHDVCALLCSDAVELILTKLPKRRAPIAKAYVFAARLPTAL
jgi:hypothetical protein